MLILYGLIGYWGLKQGKKWGAPLLWFSIGAGFHTTIDILTHVDDGPLLFYPFDWQTRFTAPISYWDPKHGGRIFAILEHILDVLLIIFLIKRRGGKTGL